MQSVFTLVAIKSCNIAKPKMFEAKNDYDKDDGCNDTETMKN